MDAVAMANGTNDEPDVRLAHEYPLDLVNYSRLATRIANPEVNIVFLDAAS
jgi:hypothetical protein